MHPYQETVTIRSSGQDQRNHIGILDGVRVIEEGIRQLHGNTSVVRTLGDGDLAGVTQRVVRRRKCLDGVAVGESDSVAQGLVDPEADVPVLVVLVHAAHCSGDHELAGVVIVIRVDVVSENESPHRELIREESCSIVIVREILVKIMAGYKRKSTGQNCEYSLFHNHSMCVR